MTGQRMLLRKTRVIAFLCVSVASIAVFGALGSEHQKTKPKSADKKSSQDVRLRVLIDNPHGGPVPLLGVPYRLPKEVNAQREMPLWKANKASTAYDITIRSSYAAIEMVVPLTPRGRQSGLRYSYESFVPQPSTFDSRLTRLPVTLGVLRILKQDKIAVNPDKGGQFTATWKGAKRASTYVVVLYHRDMATKTTKENLEYPIFVCALQRPKLSISRLALVRAIEARHQVCRQKAKERELKSARLDIQSTMQELSGKLVKARFVFRMLVTGRDEKGCSVYEAVADSIDYNVADPDELKLIDISEQ